MYMALKPMKYRKDDLSIGDVAPGQEVPGFDSWDHWTKKALIEQRMVRWSDNGEMAPDERAAAERKVVQPLPTGPLGPIERAELPVREASMFKDALPPIRSAVVDSTLREEEEMPNPLFQPTMAKPQDARIVVDTDPATVQVISCGACGKSGFKDANGLRIHQARVHKDIL